MPDALPPLFLSQCSTEEIRIVSLYDYMAITFLRTELRYILS